tara:strand:- start:4875 stop:5183 length:309 start_codon:yes stop_codon:yes gene_type:complete
MLIKFKNNRFTRVLFFLYYLEVGLVLLIAPWTTFWERNYFIQLNPVLEVLLISHVVRGAVSGIGGLCLVLVFIDIGGLARATLMLETLKRTRREASNSSLDP